MPNPTQTSGPSQTAPAKPSTTATPTLVPLPTGTPVATAAGTATAVLSPSPSARATVRATGVPIQSPLPKATTPASGVRIYFGQVALGVYPFEQHLAWETDPVSGVRYATLNRGAYDAAKPMPRAQSFEVIYLENEFLRMAFLPRWGGRLFQVTYLPTGQDLFYNNRVVKPSRWGPHAPDKNWWLALGGMEWAFPVQEHGYEWGVPWAFRTESNGGEAKITLSDSTDPARVQAQVSVTLRRGERAWNVAASAVNPTARVVPVQFWLNAMLALGERTVSSEMEFSLPPGGVRVHSTGDTRLPGERQVIAWPLYKGIDFGKYRNWQTWIGVFAQDPTAGSAAVSNPSTHLALTRTFSPGAAPGVKLFAFGPQFSDRGYTDDGSQYVELWGGPNRSFWPEDDFTLAPGASLRWTERWQLDVR